MLTILCIFGTPCIFLSNFRVFGTPCILLSNFRVFGTPCIVWTTFSLFRTPCIVLTIFRILGHPVLFWQYSVYLEHPYLCLVYLGHPVLTLSNLISPVNAVCIWQVVRCLLLISLSFLANFSIQSGQTSLIPSTTNLIPPPQTRRCFIFPVSSDPIRVQSHTWRRFRTNRNGNRAINIYLSHHPIRDENSEISNIKK